MHHIFWSCLTLQDFWFQVKHWIFKFADTRMPDDPEVFLLHLTPMCYKLDLLIHLLNTAKVCYTHLLETNNDPIPDTVVYKDY